MSPCFHFYRTQLQDSFNSPTDKEYFHYLAKNKTNPSLYNLEKLKTIREKIAAIHGECSFSRQASKLDLTPLQVSYIYGNPAAINFFKSHTDSKIQDIYGRTIEFYQTVLSWEPLFASRPQTQKELQSIRQVIPKPIALSSQPFTYHQNTNDFGKEFECVLFAPPFEKQHDYLRNERIIENMKSIADKEGFLLRFSKAWRWPRDHYLFNGLNDIMWIAPDQPELTKKALERSESLLMATGTLQHTQEWPSFLGKILKREPPPLEAFFKYESCTNAMMHTPYVEGGNYFCATNSKGIKKILMGLAHFHATHMELRLRGYFKQTPPKKIDTPLSDDEIIKGAEQMYYLGILIQDNHSGLISKDIVSNVIQKKRFNLKIKFASIKEIAIKEGWLSPFSLKPSDILKARPLVENFLAEQKAAHAFIATLLKIPEKDLHFVPSFDLHLDQFMLPGPNGSFFLQNPGTCLQILSQLEQPKYLKGLGLSLNDLTPISVYLGALRHTQEGTAPLLDKVKKVLQDAEFTVIPTPGVFQTFKDLFPGNINFINALTGWSEKNQRYFYITQGAEIPGSDLGKALMKLFEEFLKSYVPNIAVYFIGENPQKPGDFSEAMQLWNENSKGEVGALGGIHCFSFEEKTKSHTD